MKPKPEREKCEEHGKARFKSRKEAERTLKRTRRASNAVVVAVRVYWEPECGSYHVTSNPGRGWKASTSHQHSRGREPRTETRTPG